MIEYKDLHWEMDRLYYGKKDTTVRLVRDDKIDFMYWLEWNFNGPEKSINFYNLMNAKDNGKILYMRHRNAVPKNGPSSLTDAFK